MVVHFCAGTCAIAKPGTLLDKHRKFVGYIIASEVFKATKADLLLTFATQLLEVKSDITGAERLGDASLAFKKKMAAVRAHRKAATP